MQLVCIASRCRLYRVGFTVWHVCGEVSLSRLAWVIEDLKKKGGVGGVGGLGVAGWWMGRGQGV